MNIKFIAALAAAGVFTGANACAGSVRCVATPGTAISYQDFAKTKGSFINKQFDPSQSLAAMNTWIAEAKPCIQFIESITSTRGNTKGYADISAFRVWYSLPGASE